MKLRDRQGKVILDVNEKSIPHEPEIDKQKMLQDDKALELMATALKELNPEQQQCVTLFYLQKKSYLEISDATGFTMMQVKSHIQNGKRNLRILIEKKMKHP
jgi:RNA polymerase sigma-70 factor (ECF subfamily)